jgi:phytoene dehydrogenase-like protein
VTDKERRRERARGDVDERYDAIVVGAGVGGLTTAALLAQAGRRVLVVDRHYVPGGNATLFRRKRWEFDVGLHYIGECHEGGLIPRIMAACGAKGVRYRPMSPELERIRFPEFEFTIPGSRTEFEARLVERYPDERDGLRRYFRFLEQCDRAALADQGGGLLDRALSIVRGPLLVRYHQRTAGEFIDSCTQHPEIKAILTAQNGTYAIAPSRVAAVLHAGLQNHYFRSGGWYPEGGGQAMSNALAAAIEAAGGHVRLNTTVSKIDVEGGAAVGVTLEHRHRGQQQVGAATIISNADFKRTVTELVDRSHLPARFVDKARSFEMALPLFVVFLGLKIEPSDLPYDNCNLWLTDRVDVEPDYAQLQRGEMPSDPWIYISTASQKDPENPGIAPPGHSNLEVMTIVPSAPSFWGLEASQIADGSYQKVPAYLEAKQRIAEACIAQAERLIPGLRDAIVYEESATPMTHARYVRSSGGGAYGLAATPAQFLDKRPGAKTPVRGLYMCGTNCRAGHGIMGSMVSGVQAANAILGGGLQRRILG